MNDEEVKKILDAYQEALESCSSNIFNSMLNGKLKDLPFNWALASGALKIAAANLLNVVANTTLILMGQMHSLKHEAPEHYEGLITNTLDASSEMITKGLEQLKTEMFEKMRQMAKVIEETKKEETRANSQPVATIH